MSEGKAKEGDTVRIDVELKSVFGERPVPAGLEGLVVSTFKDGAIEADIALRPQTADDDGDFVQVIAAEGQYTVTRDGGWK